MPPAHRGAACLQGSQAIKVLLNRIDYWLAPLSQPVNSGCAVSGDPLPRASGCLPWARAPLPCPSPRTPLLWCSEAVILCSWRGLEGLLPASHGGLVGGLTPTPTKQAKA